MTNNNNSAPTHVVAIGASAGGLAALKLMLPTMPVGLGIAYVLVQHTDPAYPSLLDQILQRVTTLKVKTASNREAITSDYLYIIPAGMDVNLRNGMVQLQPSEHLQGSRHSVDQLFLSVANQYGENAIAIVLSGTGSDGLQGVRAIKAAQGMAIAQEPASAEYPDMPQTIIRERLTDVITAPEKIGQEVAYLLEWSKRSEPVPDNDSDAFQALIRTLVRKTGFAFDQYKETTLRRRMERRRIVTKQPDLGAYLKLVKTSNSEAELLLQDTLISVTDFFRDAKTFETIRGILRSIIARKKNDESIRIWIPGCATGEEAFSVAILLAEELDDAAQKREVQIFATDIDEHAIKVARKSVYLRPTLQHVPAALRDKYFVATDGSYKVSPSIRDMVVFAKHDLLHNPPFSRLDLVSCRNVLIYFKRPTQERLISTFHYALNPGAYLVLGPSESVGKLAELFDTIDESGKVFVRRDLEGFPPVLMRREPRTPKTQEKETFVSDAGRQEERIRDLVFDKYAPPGVLIDQRFNVLHLHGDLSRFIKLPDGNVSINLLDMVILPLRVELRLTLQKAQREQDTVRSKPVIFVDKAGKSELVLIATPTTSAVGHSSQTLVLFEARAVPEYRAETAVDDNAAFRVRELEQELSATRDHLQTNIEQLEASNEELQSVNEEYQSTTEELQSAHEELQTTNEEAQSVNEELSTANEELRVQSKALETAKRDIENILNSALAGIVVLDSEMQVIRYSAASCEFFDLIPDSIGRPLIAIGGAVDLTPLLQELHRAINTGKTVSRELELGEKSYLIRLTPINTAAGDRGLIITIFDASESLADARDAKRLAAVLKHSNDAITVQTADGQFLAWNTGAETLYGYSEAEALGMQVCDIEPDREQAASQMIRSNVFAGKTTAVSEMLRRRKDGKLVSVSVAITPLLDTQGHPYALATIERDLTLLKLAERQARQAEIALEARIITAGEMAAGLAHELNQPITSIVHFCDAALSIARDFDPARQEDLLQTLKDATAQSQRAGKIIHNLRRFLGHRESIRESIDMNSIVREAVEFIRMDGEQHDVTVHLNLADELPPVWGDPIQISQVLVNLTKNSIEALQTVDSRPRCIEISSQLDTDKAHSVRVTVEDTGPGIDKASGEHLFEPFQTNKAEGLGMGLWICRSIIQSHGGKIWVDSPTGTGARFHFLLPISSEDDHR
ncbi:CheR family methyltransferase [Congregibacter variabilis]|uniref:histidine kinase n=1 Tax=Congregibacter variabilis TaxID=3081200 RepID=A0ABZ0I4J9_9GAMM|nr:CheR family methyltransferase [Congregibacter sp. IMCC43200]